VLHLAFYYRHKILSKQMGPGGFMHNEAR